MDVTPDSPPEVSTQEALLDRLGSFGSENDLLATLLQHAEPVQTGMGNGAAGVTIGCDGLTPEPTPVDLATDLGEDGFLIL